MVQIRNSTADRLRDDESEGKPRFTARGEIDVPRWFYKKAIKEQRSAHEPDDIEDYSLSAMSLELTFTVEGVPLQRSEIG